MSNVFLYRMPAGIPGALSRAAGQATIEPQLMDSGTPVTKYGVPVKLAAGKIQPIGAGDVSTSVYGLLVRPYPVSNGINEALGTSTPPTSGPCDVTKRGYMSVKLYGATAAAKGGQAYARVANADGTHPLGGVEAASDVGVTGTAGGGNTGNGTIGTLSGTSAAIKGNYTVTMLGATTFRVSDPNGNELKNGATGAAYTAGGVTFTITVGGTPMVAGDTFTVAVAPNTVPIPGATFTGPADANGITELAFNI